MDEEKKKDEAPKAEESAGGEEPQGAPLIELGAARRRVDGFTWDDGLGLSDEYSSEAAHWSVPWSDLMMVMFILFAVLFTYSMYQKDLYDAFEIKGENPEVPRAVASGLQEPAFDIDPEDIFRPRPEKIRTGTPEDILRKSAGVVEEAGLEGIDAVLQGDRSVKLSVRGPMYFDPGKTELKGPARYFLERLAPVLRPLENRIVVKGHADDRATSGTGFPSNWELSALRASAVARFLVGEGIDPRRLTVEAHSKYRPEFPNTTPLNRARNRRVEIIVTDEKLQKGHSEK